MSKDSEALKFLDPVLVSRLDNMELRAKLIVEGFMTGLHKSPYHGFSVEFAEHRPYNTGDEFRHVDWRVYAKSDKFFVKQYEEETNLRHYVVLDTSTSMRYKGNSEISKLEYAAYLSAALHYLMIKQKDASGLIAFDEDIHTVLPPKSTRRYMRQLLSELERIVKRDDTDKRTSAAETLGRVAERIGRRSLVVLISDLFENVDQHEELITSLRHLRYSGHEVLVFHLLDTATEREFKFPDVPMLFKDLETGEQLTLQPAQIRENYREAVRLFSERFKRRCIEYHIDFVEIDTAEDYGKALMAYLHKRALLK